jgi:HlyD family secretion protein
MKRKLSIFVAVAAVLALGGYGVVASLSGPDPVDYQLSPITRGDLELTISATGTLSPVTIIDVGTQVSGTIDSVFVDYNDHVKDGQILAVLDTTLLKIAVLDAEASVERVDAQLDQATADYGRNRAMFDRGLISESDFLPFSVALKVQKASLKSAKMALERAKRNLDYAVITSPIGGTIIAKNVEAGQTVASSFSTPTLFRIAQDLSRMEILVDVDESDIGQVKEGQIARFQVATYSDREFKGTVRQIRLEPKTVSNVVTYDVVVQAVNDEGLLLPGMTATVDIIVNRKENTLMVADKALRFQPAAEQLDKVQKDLGDRPRHVSQSPAEDSSASAEVAAASLTSDRKNSSSRQKSRNAGVLWYLDPKGKLSEETVRTGLSDGVNTEILVSGALTEGMQVISGIKNSSQASSRSQSSGSSTFRRPPGF